VLFLVVGIYIFVGDIWLVFLGWGYLGLGFVRAVRGFFL